MLTINKNIYELNELEYNSKEKAYNSYLASDAFDYTDYFETLKQFCNMFDIELNNYSCDTYRGYIYNFTSNACIYSNIEYCKGLRLSKFINNNYYFRKEYLHEGKKTVYKGARAYSENCCLTGFCADYDILRHIVLCSEYKVIYDDFNSLISACLDSFFSALLDEMRFDESMEAFEEYCEAESVFFYKDGSRVATEDIIANNI